MTVLLTDVASAALENVASPVSELGHGRVPRVAFPTFGPHRDACVCWHLENVHDRCVAVGCVCAGRFRRPVVYGWLTLALAVLRGGCGLRNRGGING